MRFGGSWGRRGLGLEILDELVEKGVGWVGFDA